MGMSSGGGGGRAPLSEINVTPLVDVMLVLLIIFMVAAPLMSQNQVPIDLPRAQGQSSKAADDKVLLSITAEKKVFLGETEVPPGRVVEALEHNARLAEQGEVYVQADRNVPYGFVVEIFSAVREAGVGKLGLVTEPLGGSPASSEPGAATDSGEQE